MKKLLLLLFIGIINFSCKKDNPEPIVATPVVEEPKDNWEFIKEETMVGSRVHFVLDDKTAFIAFSTSTTIKFVVTNDGGKTWETKDSKIAAERVYSIHFEDKNLGYASFFLKGVFRTKDGGSTWEKVHDCKSCPLYANRGVFIVYSGESQSRSHDKGDSYIEIDSGNINMFWPIETFSFGKNLYYLYENGLIVSKDDGINWSDLKVPFSKITNIVTLTSTKWFLNNSNGLFVTENSGQSWTNLEENYFGGFRSAAKKDTLFITRSNKIYWTLDGKNFTLDSEKFDKLNVLSIGNQIIGYNNDGIYKRRF